LYFSFALPETCGLHGCSQLFFYLVPEVPSALLTGEVTSDLRIPEGISELKPMRAIN
jgi:hypothetical protein